MNWDFLGNIWFWAIILGLGTIGYAAVGAKLRRLPLIGGLMDKKTLTWVGLGGVLVVSGLLGNVISGSGSANLSSAEGYQISDLQITTSFTTDIGDSATVNCSVAVDPSVDDVLNLRCADAGVSETAGSEELYTGIITVTRTGNMDPSSCSVRAILPPVYEDQAAPDGRTYNIIEKTSLDEYEVYLQNGAAATINSPKETTALAFSDGASTQTLGIAMEVDEAGHDALNQYNYKSVVIDICGKPFVVNIHRMD